ncbi:MAG TPA: NADH-quinone oxidoreductase subunit A [Candidatus Azoamicus sp. OHIO1]
MVESYLPVLIFFIFSFLFGIIPSILGSLLAPKNPNKEKLSQYECGFEPFEDSRMKFNIKFYFVGILFIIFDLEIAFLFPWAVCIDFIDIPGLIGMAIFLIVLTIGFIYEWKKGALEWE